MKYCGMCDRWLKTTKKECPLCGDTLEWPARKMTRQEKLEALADSGCDTHEERRGER